jgi:predicted TPR repeat methyltransferase
MPRYDRAYWDALYAQDIDPWHFRTSAYERDKYATTIAALGGRTFRCGLELGCSIGVLTRQLAAHCDRLVAVDTSERALEEARRHCPYAHVEFRQAHLPNGHLDGRYDLIVASEILYYLHPPALIALARRLKKMAEPDAWLLSVHWTGSTDYPLSAQDATTLCFDASGVEHVRTFHAPGFRLDLGRFAR